MRFYEEKWTNSVYDLYPHVDRYVNTIGPIIGHVQKRHKDDVSLCGILHRLNDFFFNFYYANLKPLRPGKESTLEEKVRYNTSVTTLKEVRRRFSSYIEAKFNGHPPHRNKIIWPDVPGSKTAPVPGPKHEWHRVSRWRKEMSSTTK